MIISHKKKFIFLHIYKVAGSSIREALSIYSYVKTKKNLLLSAIGYYPNYFSEDFPDHTSARDARTRIGRSLFKQYFKFAFIRNPWDWQVSLFHFAQQTPHHYQHKLISSMSFDRYIRWRVNEDLHLQSEFICDQDGSLLVDFIGKYEHLENDFDFVCNRLNLQPQTKLKWKNPSNHKNYTEYYSDETAQIIADAYQQDIKLFDYTFK